MKVLQINAVNGIRSTGRICTEIAEYLEKHEIQGYIAYSCGLKPEKGYKIGTPLEMKIHGLCSRISGKQAYFSKMGTNKLINYIEEIKPDIVHLHNLHGNYINLKLVLNYLAREDIATVLTLHDCWFYTGKCAHYTVDKCYKWQSECGNCPRLKKDNPSWFFDRTKEMFNDKKEYFEKIPRLAVVGVSDWITNEARKSYLSSAEIMKRIYNWTDFEIFKPVDTTILRKELELDNKFIILGVATSWSNAKGLNKFLELASLIPKDMVIMLVGNMDKRVSIPKNIIHIKETHNMDELVKYYSLSDVFVNLSQEESFGKVTAEALACGTPAIVINSTANPELIGKGCGYIIEKNDSSLMKDAILKVYSNSKQYYSDNCRNYAKTNFSMDDRIFDYMRIYRELSKKNIRRNK